LPGAASEGYSATCTAAYASMDTRYQDVRDACHEEEGYTKAQIAGYTIGGVLLIVGVALILTDSTPEHASTNAQRRERNQRLRFGAAPILTPGYQGGVLQVQF
jgi:hypothetical protein